MKDKEIKITAKVEKSSGVYNKIALPPEGHWDFYPYQFVELVSNMACQHPVGTEIEIIIRAKE